MIFLSITYDNIANEKIILSIYTQSIEIKLVYLIFFLMETYSHFRLEERKRDLRVIYNRRDLTICIAIFLRISLLFNATILS